MSFQGSLLRVTRSSIFLENPRGTREEGKTVLVLSNRYYEVD